MLRKSFFTYLVAFLTLFATTSSAANVETTPQESGDGYINSTQQMVDLGLSVCWAGWNIGATSPEEYGSHFAWGETASKNYFSEPNYVFHDGDSYVYIGSDISGTQYDAARAQWGGTWRLPSKAECEELINNCTWQQTTYRGVAGYKVTGPNGNAIFLPFAGNYYCENEIEVATAGDYWTGGNDQENDANATLMYITNEGLQTTTTHWREFGRSIRAVAPRTSSSPVISSSSSSSTDSKINDIRRRLRDHVAQNSGLATSNSTISTSQKVDLGLSVYWAGWNIGATSPEEYGNHFAWGETTPKSYFSEPNYTYHNGEEYLYIGRNICGTQYDAARAQWGGTWRLPSKAECEELINNCTWQQMTYRGVAGYKVTGPNGNAIFLPFAGNYYCENENEIATAGDYWTGDYVADDGSYANLMYVTSEDARMTLGHWREFGRSIRAVSDR